MVWDYAESSIFSDAAGDLTTSLGSMCRVLDRLGGGPVSIATQSDAQSPSVSPGKVVSTDPPYYDAIPYSDLMDYFYVWLRRAAIGFDAESNAPFSTSLTPKWNTEDDDGELIDDASRFGGDKKKSKEVYEAGMFRSGCAGSHRAFVGFGSI